jgi:hypothetical protein
MLTLKASDQSRCYPNKLTEATSGSRKLNLKAEVLTPFSMNSPDEEGLQLFVRNADK